jgi:hypothetical protein
MDTKALLQTTTDAEHVITDDELAIALAQSSWEVGAILSSNPRWPSTITHAPRARRRRRAAPWWASVQPMGWR